MKKCLSALLTLLLVASALSFGGLTAFAQANGDFEYKVLSEEDKTCEITGYTGSAEVLDIPAQLDGYTVTSIGIIVFQCRNDLKRVTIPQGVTSIGNNAFFACNNLTEVTIPEGVTSIGTEAFSNCSLTEVNIPQSVTSIGIRTFASCNDLTKFDVDSRNTVYSSKDGVLFNKAQTELLQYPLGKSNASYAIPDNVTSIGNDAFGGCDNLTAVTIPEGVTSIGNYAFEGCDNLTTVTIPGSVTSIGSHAFYNTGYYNTASNWVDGVLYLDNCLLDVDFDEISNAYSILSGTRVIANYTLVDCDSLTAVTIPESVTNIGADTFWSCDNLTTVTISEGVRSIGKWAFMDSTSLTTVTIPRSTTSIGEGAFAYCDSLTTVTISEGVRSIGEWAFMDCDSLTTVTIPRNVTSIGDNAFYKSGLTTIYGYSGSCAESYAKENGFAFIALAELHDTKSGITVAATAVDTFPENAERAVSVVDTANDRITYDISLQAGGKAIRPNGNVTVKIPVPEKMDGANVKVYRQEADGTLTDMHAIFQDGYAVFTTDHFSRYILEGEAAKTPSTPTDPAKPTDPTQPTQPTDPANPQPGQNGTTQAPANNAHTDIPKTGSASNALAGTCAFMLAIAAVGALGLKKAYRKKQAQA